MEQQFILRVPANLSIEEESFELKVLSDNKVILKNDKEVYEGVVVKLPTIIESHKTLDNKQFYKVADVGSMIQIKDKKGEDIEDDKELNIELLETSGITPPMKFAKIRRFRKKHTKAYKAEEIERKVEELLKRDAEAISVTIVRDGEEDTAMETEDEDMSSMAAELEQSLLESDKNVEINEEIKIKKQQLAELKAKLKVKEEFMESAINPIVQRRFKEAWELLKQQCLNLEDEIKKLENK
ncbi:Transcription initiation factor TFIID subunit 7 [Astathelohania contejeani]|uniref:Transcription initiation factor TFIID subunit 7 n=1 Tax=Astathelohania contejeani TaxID=164912 RepID=A0ABQ7I023_9MICR|nr:Transcription initiation factor TFIID subunit 7 [Thelohania contejeani]